MEIQKSMDGNVHWLDKPFKPIKRKRGVDEHRVSPQKGTRCQAIVPNKCQDPSQITDMAFDPLQNLLNSKNSNSKHTRRRYNAFSVQKMVRLVTSQTRFLCDFVHHPYWTSDESDESKKFEEALHRVGVCKADSTSSNLAVFYIATAPIRGTCIVKHKYRKCIVLGMEHRTNAPSFRLYLAYFSQSRFYYICHVQFLIKQLLLQYGADVALVSLIMQYCFYGLVRKGFEIAGAHYMDPLKARGKPDICVAKSKHVRHFTSMWDNRLGYNTQREINFMVSHARRDVQVFELRVESHLYKNLLCGKL